MKNIDLNAGGIIGAILAAIIGGALIFTNVDPSDPGPSAKLFIVGIIAGAVGGTFIWGLVFPKN